MGGDTKGSDGKNLHDTISIHTTHVGGDSNYRFLFAQLLKFQSTPPMWVVTITHYSINIWRIISIHTTHVGGDQ